MPHGGAKGRAAGHVQAQVAQGDDGQQDQHAKGQTLAEKNQGVKGFANPGRGCTLPAWATGWGRRRGLGGRDLTLHARAMIWPL